MKNALDCNYSNVDSRKQTNGGIKTPFMVRKINWRTRGTNKVEGNNTTAKKVRNQCCSFIFVELLDRKIIKWNLLDRFPVADSS